MKYVEESSSLGFAIERSSNGTPQRIVFKDPRTATSLSDLRVPTAAALTASAGPKSATLSRSAAPPAGRTESQLVRLLKEYMEEGNLQEMEAGSLAAFYKRYNITKGDFSPRFIALHPDVGLQLKTVRGTGHVIVMTDKAQRPVPQPVETVNVAAIARAATPPPTMCEPISSDAVSSREVSPSFLDNETTSFEDEETLCSQPLQSRQYQHSSSILAQYPVGTRKYLSFNDSGMPTVSDTPLHPSSVTALTQPNTRAEIDALLKILPPLTSKDEQKLLEGMIHLPHATEIVYDLGRPPVMRFQGSSAGSTELTETAAATATPTTSSTTTWTQPLSKTPVTSRDIEHILRALGGDDRFSSDNRCGLDNTLHRISRRPNRQNVTIGFTMRIGRMIPGSTIMISDLIAAKKSILLIGCPGVGKTTLLRDLARVLSESEESSIEIIDTSNEIAGEGDVPHHSIGKARRMMVRDRRRQHDVMIETVQNHMPTCLIIDEIGTKQEARAAVDVRHRGIQLIGTAHGTGLRQLIENPELNGLFGGIHTVILGDEEASRRKLRTKSVQERMGPCAFDCAIELCALRTWVIHHNLAEAVDRLLLKKPMTWEVRRLLPPKTTTSQSQSLGDMTIEVVNSVEPFHPPPMTVGP